MFRLTGNSTRRPLVATGVSLISENLHHKINIHPISLATSSRYASTSKENNKRTCLFDFHTRHQARLESFAGYMMPIVYKNQTIKSEHMQTRTLASAFDVSHMMQTNIRGKDRSKFLESLTVADVEGLGINRCTLSMITNESGGIIDDCIIGKRQNHIHMVSNAGNAEKVWSWLNSKLDNKFEVELERLDGAGLIALQGPKAAQVLQTMVDVKLSAIDFMSIMETNIKDIGTCQVTRCGYTGEDGFEISVDSENVESLMELLCKQEFVKPAGLGARDTLRLEAGLCLHGHDITEQTTPVEAALSWTIAKRRRLKGGFPGSDVILNQLKNGSKVKRVGLISIGSGPPARENCPVTQMRDETVLGHVTSGNFAPVLERNIAMAYIPTSLATKYDQSVECSIRGKKYEYRITRMPFVKTNYYVRS